MTFRNFNSEIVKLDLKSKPTRVDDKIERVITIEYEKIDSLLKQMFSSTTSVLDSEIL